MSEDCECDDRVKTCGGAISEETEKATTGGCGATVDTGVDPGDEASKLLGGELSIRAVP